jgi:hypothetical protein
MGFTVCINRRDEEEGFDEIAHELRDWARAQGGYEDDDPDAYAAEALSESLCTCHGNWPRSDTARDPLNLLLDTGSFRVSFDHGFTVFEVRYASPDETEKPT